MSWSPLYGIGRYLLAAACLLITTLTFSFAQSPQQRNVCFGREAAAPAAQVTACTAIIEAGRDQPSIISEAYVARGNFSRAKEEFDQAIDDFTQAIQLNGRNANAYYNRGLSRVAKGD